LSCADYFLHTHPLICFGEWIVTWL
jgi:hypothetical protein